MQKKTIEIKRQKIDGSILWCFGMKRIRYLDYNSIFSLITCAIKLDIFGKSCDKNWPRIYNKSKYLKVSNDRQESHISVCHMLFFTSLLIERMSRSINHWINQSRHIFKTLSTWECAYHRQTINSMWWLRCARLFCEFKRKTRFTHKLQKRRNINRTATITKIAKKNSWLSPQTQNFNTFLLYISQQANGEYPWKKISYMIVDNTEYARQSVKRSSILMFQCTEWIYRSVWWWCLSMCVRVCVCDEYNIAELEFVHICTYLPIACVPIGMDEENFNI